MRGWLTIEVVALNYPGEAPAFAGSNHVNTVSLSKDIYRQALAFLNVDVLDAKLAQVLDGR